MRQRQKCCSLAVAAAVMSVLSSGGAMAGECNEYYYGTSRVDTLEYCSSSHLSASRVATYEAENLDRSLVDPDGQLAWCEGVKGDGINEWVRLRMIRGGAFVKTVTIANGYQKSKESFYENNRVRDIRIDMDSGLSVTARLADSFGDQVIRLPDWQDMTQVRITVLSVYHGSKYQDTCLTKLALDYEEGIEFEMQQSN